MVCSDDFLDVLSTCAIKVEHDVYGEKNNFLHLKAIKEDEKEEEEQDNVFHLPQSALEDVLGAFEECQIDMSAVVTSMVGFK